MINVNVIGRLGADAEILNGKNGGQYVRFRLATDDFKNGEKTTTWISATFSGERALAVAQYLKKGSHLSISGRQELNIYNDRNGQPQIGVTVIVHNIDFVSSGNSEKSEDNAQNNITTGTPVKGATAPKAESVPTAAAVTAPPAPTAQDNDDDLPF